MVAKKKDEGVLEKEKKEVKSEKADASVEKESWRSSKKVSGTKKTASVATKRASKKLKESVKEVKEKVEASSEKGKKERKDEVNKSEKHTSEKKEDKKESGVKVSKSAIGKAVRVVNELKSIAGKSVGKIGEVNGDTARATGHRKRAIAKVICQFKGNKPVNILVNELDYKAYFTNSLNQKAVYAPFALIGVNTGYIVRAEVFGGGKSGQADALKLGISRCLSLLSEEFNAILRKNSFLTRDSRKVEPKKAGLRKARKKEQFSKR